MKYTDNYQLKKPETTDFYDVEDGNENTEIIDKKLKELETAKENIDKAMTALKKYVSDGKSILASAITTMGVDASSDDTFQELKDEIESITPTLSWDAQNVSADINGSNVVSNSIAYWQGNASDKGMDIVPDRTVKTVFETGDRGYFAGPLRVASLGGNATAENVLENKTFSSNNAGRTANGAMHNNGAVSSALNCGESISIPMGYHNGQGKVTANSLTSQTGATASAGDVFKGKTAWVDGKQLTGTMTNNGNINASLNCGGKYVIPTGYHAGAGVVTANSLINQTVATASAMDILDGQTAWINGSKTTGSMTNNGAVSNALNCSGTYTIPVGYHNGQGKVTANSLASQTGATASSGDVFKGKTAWVDGKQLTGTMANNGAVSSTLNCSGTYTIPVGYHNGSGKVTVNSLSSQTGATASTGDILKDKTAWVNGNKLTGIMPNNGTVSSSLNCGGTYTIPAGYHNGSGKVTANSLASQTSATASAANILSGQTAWVNGNKITGTMTNQGGYTTAASTAIGGETLYVYTPKGAYMTAGGNGTYPEITVPSIGNASASQVLSGCTFTSSAGKCVTGTMASNSKTGANAYLVSSPDGSLGLPAGYYPATTIYNTNIILGSSYRGGKAISTVNGTGTFSAPVGTNCQVISGSASGTFGGVKFSSGLYLDNCSYCLLIFCVNSFTGAPSIYMGFDSHSNAYTVSQQAFENTILNISVSSNTGWSAGKYLVYRASVSDLSGYKYFGIKTVGIVSMSVYLAQCY